MSTRPAPAGQVSRPALPLAVVTAAMLLFAVLVTANSAGYRFGVSDQAFYIPAIDRAVTPSLFPHDAALVGPQARLLVIDDGFGWLVRRTGIGLPDLFLAGYAVTLLIFAAGALRVASGLQLSTGATMAFLIALTLRHRITQTGVNTFEGYFHPRVLAFAFGLLVIAAVLRQRLSIAAALVVAAAAVHPTTGVWFGVLVLGALFTRPGGWRLAALLAAAGAAVGVAVVTSGAVQGALTVMDPPWTAVFASKDYLFPTEWPVKAWLVNAIAPLVLAGVFALRARAGLRWWHCSWRRYLSRTYGSRSRCSCRCRACSGSSTSSPRRISRGRWSTARAPRSAASRRP
jgi:hypothetical protein